MLSWSSRDTSLATASSDGVSSALLATEVAEAAADEEEGDAGDDDGDGAVSALQPPLPPPQQQQQQQGLQHCHPPPNEVLADAAALGKRVRQPDGCPAKQQPDPTTLVVNSAGTAAAARQDSLPPPQQQQQQPVTPALKKPRTAGHLPGYDQQPAGTQQQQQQQQRQQQQQQQQQASASLKATRFRLGLLLLRVPGLAAACPELRQLLLQQAGQDPGTAALQLQAAGRLMDFWISAESANPAAAAAAAATLAAAAGLTVQGGNVAGEGEAGSSSVSCGRAVQQGPAGWDWAGLKARGVPGLLLQMVLHGSSRAAAAAAGGGEADVNAQQALEQSCCAALKAAYHHSVCSAAPSPGAARGSSSSATGGTPTTSRREAAQGLVREMLHLSNQAATQGLPSSCARIAVMAVAAAAAAVRDPSSSDALLRECKAALQQLHGTALPAAVWDQLIYLLLQQQQQQRDGSGVAAFACQDLVQPVLLLTLRQLLALL
uniref:Uncharacterized protein n=1 Tax=Tetradesmus obliquus TaxID=3088 RepID=A0A383V8D4_TETOB|eukprot:jgi/Sobl393_1/3305/SZX61835.1